MQLSVDWTSREWKEARGGWELLTEWTEKIDVDRILAVLLKEYFELAHTILALHRKECPGRKLTDLEKEVFAAVRVHKHIYYSFSRKWKDFSTCEEHFIRVCVAIVRTERGAACVAHYAMPRRSLQGIRIKANKMFENVNIPTGDYASQLDSDSE